MFAFKIISFCLLQNVFETGESLIKKIEQLEVLLSIRNATIKQLEGTNLQMAQTIRFQEKQIRKLNNELAKNKENMNESDLLSSPQLIKK